MSHVIGGDVKSSAVVFGRSRNCRDTCMHPRGPRLLVSAKLLNFVLQLSYKTFNETLVHYYILGRATHGLLRNHSCLRPHFLPVRQRLYAFVFGKNTQEFWQMMSDKTARFTVVIITETAPLVVNLWHISVCIFKGKLNYIGK